MLFVSFVFLTALMMVWLNYSGNLATLFGTIILIKSGAYAPYVECRRPRLLTAVKFIKRSCASMSIQDGGSTGQNDGKGIGKPLYQALSWVRGCLPG